MDDKQPIVQENDSLESPATVIEQAQGETQPLQETDNVTSTPPATEATPHLPFKLRVLYLLKRFNIYIVLLLILVSVLGVITVTSIRKNNQSQPKVSTDTETLSGQSLEEIGSSDIKVGDAKQTLNIESNTIFSGKILARDNVDIAGSLTVGGSLSLAGIEITGTSQLDEARLESLAVTGNTTFQGAVSLQNNLNVSGTASFGGNVSAPQITVDTLELNKDLKINRHITASGGTPSRNNGASIGAGGTTSVNGSDTAGTVTINTGSNAPAGCLVNVTFSQSYAAAPRIVVTPSSSNAATLDYYINKTSTGFSICTASDPPDGSGGMTFDYIVIG